MAAAETLAARIRDDMRRIATAMGLLRMERPRVFRKHLASGLQVARHLGGRSLFLRIYPDFTLTGP